MLAFRIAISTIIALLVAKRLIEDIGPVRRAELPWTGMIIPAAILLAGVLVLTGIIARAVTMAAMLVIDISLLALCFSILRSARASKSLPVEVRISRALDQFFPEWFGRVASTDIVTLLHARRGLQEVIAPQYPTPLTYTSGSKLGLAALIVGIACLPDAVFFWLLIPHSHWYVALVLDVLDVWACLWLFGALGTMVMRPHTFDGSRLTLRNGLFQRIELDVNSIARCDKLGIRRPWQLPKALRRNAAVLAVGGVPLVHLFLNSEVDAYSAFRLGPRPVREIVVASDDVDGFIALATAGNWTRNLDA